ncbi:SigE family RNA polymerase sigma factor [Nocardioides sp. zg-1228]|uniref:SigE family RNA polymerase sigma factor n=1 Tax=Nocardioides sp. zg-1228 TaxID=2763008 RepID=UPI0016435906|nr:SigE family RNA polymerase sigma factor [Nocardioides sp. zg-1228]MBC2932643.1 SigE family RNA polymerase sigma factor [Nocardioides sp. zg-1228]QSF58127.1 SigE family RNA polymerase sigma factor [Nocardioides sp. zg-1228]
MIARAEQPAFDAFVRRSSDRLLRTAYLLCGDRGHAEDIVQTALLRTARRWPSARREPEAYARRVVVNLAKDRWRALGRRPGEAPLEADVAVPVTDGVADRDQILRAARQLPAGQRAVLVLRYFDDLSVADTAAALGCSTGTVKSQTARALERLRAALTSDREKTDAHRR